MHQLLGELLAGRFWWLVPIAAALLGIGVGRWWVAFTPLALWGPVAVFLVANDGWHGFGWGDFGIAWNVIAAFASFAGAATGVALRKGASRTTTSASNATG
jgi:hypothetical protein